MRRLVYLCLFCLTLVSPWQEVTVLGQVTSASRLFGYIALGAAFLAVVLGGRLRPPGLALFVFALFVAWATLTVAWSLAPQLTLERSVTYLMLLGFAWMVREFADTPAKVRGLLLAFLVGCIPPFISLYLGYRAEEVDAASGGRFSATGTNANGMAVNLVWSIAIAFYFATNRETFLRRLSIPLWGYMLFAAIAVFLTGSRAGVLALAILIACILVALRRVNWKTTFMFLAAAAAAWYVLPRMLPENLQNRLMEGTSAHTLQTRIEFWRVGLAAWLDCPIQGVGSSAYQAVTERDSGKAMVAHNTVVSVLVEDGLVGFGLFTLTWLLAIYPIRRLPRREKLVCLSLLCSFIPVVLSGSAEYAKGFWWLYGVILASCALPLPKPSTTRMPARQRPDNSRPNGNIGRAWPAPRP